MICSGSPYARVRLCDQASPGQILVSEDIAAAAEGTRLSFHALEAVHLKGFPEAVAVFAVGVQER